MDISMESDKCIEFANKWSFRAQFTLSEEEREEFESCGIEPYAASCPKLGSVANSDELWGWLKTYKVSSLSKRIHDYESGASSHAIKGMNFFKDDIEPLWEHSKNEEGCKIRFIVNYYEMDDFWEELVLLLALNSFENSEHINGVRVVWGANSGYVPVVNYSQSRFEIWLDTTDETIVKQIKNEIFKKLKEMTLANGQKATIKKKHIIACGFREKGRHVTVIRPGFKLVTYENASQKYFIHN
eukprot:TRINITY_DN779941_c0_g1_i1.p1 TRINITY_DN779941_c0_g1~~TRINITY_DN779941_c0_g1_i1.p1  ORF type:complete len:242 (-),score=48.22 TRINITY_DN779941_c0_g1_i1:111-836(-)